MIADISGLKEHSLAFIRSFLAGCTVQEKIDAYHVCVEIHTRRLVFRKSAAREITREDMILNSMYGRLVKDWEIFRMANEEWFSAHRGYTISMFFLPCRKPILIEYVSGVSYIIDRMTAPDGSDYIEQDSSDLCSLNRSHEFGIRRLENLVIKDIPGGLTALASRIKAGDEDWLDDFIDFSQSTLFAAGVPEGYIFRFGPKHIMQHICTNPETGQRDAEERTGSTEKSQFEYLLTDFISYWESIDDISSRLVPGDYVKSICLLFNSYITEREKVGHKIAVNVDAQSLEPPCVGMRFDVGYDYIPDATTRNLCHEDVLYKNIFKILLANLKRKKTQEHCILLKKERIEKWNEIVTTLKNVC